MPALLRNLRLACFTLLTVAGCGPLFGRGDEFVVEPMDGPAQEEGAANPSSEGEGEPDDRATGSGSQAGELPSERPDEGASLSCRPGELQCNQSNLEVCIRSDSRAAPRWVVQLDCGSAELCVQQPDPHCVAQACSRGDATCEGPIPLVCDESQTHWIEGEPCLSAAHCSNEALDCPNGPPCCLQAPCATGEVRCNGEILEACNGARTAWEPVEACSTVSLCSSGLAACEAGTVAECACEPPACDIGEMRCDGAVLQRCNEARDGWDFVNECASEALCELGLERSPVSCEPPRCFPGSHACDEATLQRCAEDQTGFVFDEQCVGPPFCNAAAGVCEDAPCEVGEQRCNAAQIQTCRSDRTGFQNSGTPCASAPLCIDFGPGPARCDPPQCFAGDFVCNDNQLMRCNDGLTAFENFGAPCPRGDLCSVARRRCDFCVPNRRECNIEATASRTCAPDGNSFGPETFCPLGCERSNGLCNTCPIGSYRCQGNTIQRCNDGFSFTSLGRGSDCSSGNTVNSCVNGQLQQSFCGLGCNFQRSQCNQCSPGQSQCAGGGAFQQCVNGQFGSPQGCAAGFRCQQGVGQCRCSGAGPRCAGATLQECNAAGTSYVAAPRCDGAVLRTCAAGQVDTDVCDSAAVCEDSVGATCE